MGKTKYVSAFERGLVEGARHTSLSRTAMLQIFLHKPDTTVGSIGVNMGQHPCGTLLTPCRAHALTN
jgi:hypothetical protein